MVLNCSESRGVSRRRKGVPLDNCRRIVYIVRAKVVHAVESYGRYPLPNGPITDGIGLELDDWRVEPWKRVDLFEKGRIKTSPGGFPIVRHHPVRWYGTRVSYALSEKAVPKPIGFHTPTAVALVLFDSF